MNAPETGLLTLASPAACLQQARAPLMSFRTLVGLGPAQAEQVLMPSLERMAGWVLNLDVAPGAGQGLLFCAALEAGALRLANAPEAPLERLAIGLGGVLYTLAAALSCSVVQAPGRDDVPRWGAHAGSLWGWARAHEVAQVRCERAAAAVPAVAAVALLAGRVLSGATLACLDAGSMAALEPLWAEGAGVGSALGASVAQAAASLVQRGLWQPLQAPGRIWQESGRWHLLWPLAGEDLRTEVALLGGERLMPESWLAALRDAGCVCSDGGPQPSFCLHPLLRRTVQACVAAGPLEATLRRLMP
ncbi:MAG: hypothetical protein KGI47_08640 [Betaproteobacteria bacterium]|nr:hypothetical protein [Betaproteobacteria bacterium]